MPPIKDKTTGKWNAYFRYTDWQGNRKQKLKRGFATKREANEYERDFLQQKTADLDMSFGTFVEIYEQDRKGRLKLSTWLTKEHIIRTKLLPAFGERVISEIAPKDVIQWQNEMMKLKSPDGEPYSSTYLKTLHNQLSAIFNHAVRYYDLKSNPAARAGNMGKEKPMLLSPSANRAKSWSCEHCENWTRKDASFCLRCFWAYPEDHDHIAGRIEKEIAIIFTGDEIEDYNKLIEISGEETAQQTIKNIIHEYLQ